MKENEELLDNLVKDNEAAIAFTSDGIRLILPIKDMDEIIPPELFSTILPAMTIATLLKEDNPQFTQIVLDKMKEIQVAAESAIDSTEPKSSIITN